MGLQTLAHGPDGVCQYKQLRCNTIQQSLICSTLQPLSQSLIFAEPYAGQLLLLGNWGAESSGAMYSGSGCSVQQSAQIGHQGSALSFPL